MSARALSRSCLGLVLLGLIGAAGAAEEPPPGPQGPRSVVVLEFRNAVSQALELSGQLAQALSRNTSLHIIDLREARRRLGPRMDAEVARCAGEVACLSVIGQGLGASEVLLLALSQLGDVVLAIQRIDVATRSVSGRVADSIPAGRAPDEARVLTWLQQLYPPETFKRYGQIRINTDVDGAQVYINTKARGKTPLHDPVSVLAPGNYRVLVEKTRYLPFQVSLSVMPDATAEVTARLTPETLATPWHRRWYVWAAIGGGVVLAAGAVGLYAGLSREPVDMTRVPTALDIR